MRTKKFRGKCVPDSKLAGEWVEGGFAPNIIEDNDAIIIEFLNSSTAIMRHVIPESVGQFTGLHDDNGKDIYEGDIIGCLLSNGEPMRHLIVYDEKEASFKAERCGCRCPVTQEWIDVCHYTIVGNTIDTPDFAN